MHPLQPTVHISKREFRRRLQAFYAKRLAVFVAVALGTRSALDVVRL